jgi:predicted hotdog family 3-hydroxylacyl-ACP dehydratase
MSFPDIHELLLHRDTMLLIDRVLAFTSLSANCEFTPQATAWYAGADGAMPAWFGIELMAQGIATHIALQSREAGRPPKPGALLGTRDYRANSPRFPASHPLLVEVTQTYLGDDGLAAYDCWVRNNSNETLASATLTVFEPTDFKDFIAGATK